MIRLIALCLLLTGCAGLPKTPDRGSFSLDDEILKTWARRGRHPMICTFKYDAAVYRDVTCYPQTSAPAAAL